MNSARETVRSFFLSGQGSVLREVRMNDSVTDLFLPYPEWKRNDKMYSGMSRYSWDHTIIYKSVIERH